MTLEKSLTRTESTITHNTQLKAAKWRSYRVADRRDEPLLPSPIRCL